MEKKLEVSFMLDFYNKLLTEKQADTLDFYYNQDLSLSEIAEHLAISRQGVRDSIKRGERLLYELEEKLGLVKRFNSIHDKLALIEKNITAMEVLNAQHIQSSALLFNIEEIKRILTEIDEKV